MREDADSSNSLPRPGTPENASAIPTDKHHRRVIVGVVLVLATVFFALLLPVPFYGRAATAIGDLVHAPLFGSLALAWLWIWQRLDPLHGLPVRPRIHQGRRLVARGVIVWIVLSLFGLVMEFLQGGTGRSASRHDAIANSLGIAAAISGYTGVWFISHRRKRVAWLFASVAAMILAVAWWRPITLLADVVLMPKQFPMLASFESSAELTRWYLRSSEGKRVRDDATDGQFAFEVEFDASHFPAITLIDMVPDWNGYSALELDATLDEDHRSSSVSLLVRIVDESNRDLGAFSQSTTLSRGQRQHIRLPLAGFRSERARETIDFSQVIFVDVGPIDSGSAVKIRFDRLVLAK